ncbi:MAG: ExbD/TolR family protein [Pirellulales bacterium]
MKYKKYGSGGAVEIDMTPMIDMTFQLIAFFMFTLSFADAEQNELIKLPGSELAKPPDAPLEKPLALQVAVQRDSANQQLVPGVPPYVIYNGDNVLISNMKPHLEREKEVLVRTGGKVANSTVIIRADRDVPTGQVQNLIRACQETGFEKFVLRAKEEQ